jgi:hypothetical protein
MLLMFQRGYAEGDVIETNAVEASTRQDKAAPDAIRTAISVLDRWRRALAVD